MFCVEYGRDTVCSGVEMHSMVVICNPFSGSDFKNQCPDFVRQAFDFFISCVIQPVGWHANIIFTSNDNVAKLGSAGNYGSGLTVKTGYRVFDNDIVAGFE